MSRLKHVLVVSDPAYPLANTGFSIVTGALIEGLRRHPGLRLSHLARGLNVIPEKNPFKFPIYVPGSADPNGYSFISQVIQGDPPDLVLYEADPGSIGEWRKNPDARMVRTLVHTPVEARPLLAPLAEEMAGILEMGGRITTYTDFTKETIHAATKELLLNFALESTKIGGRLPQFAPMEALGLGVDHADWGRDEELRDKTRRSLGWQNRFVVLNVARNAERKQWPRLFEAMALLKDQYPEILLYAHTIPFENYFLRGHNLFALRRFYDLQGHVTFKRDLTDPLHGLPFDGTSECGDAITLKAIYNAADLFVAPTGGEGWNLPLCEAAACGLPCATTMYAGGWEVAREFAWGLPVCDYTTDSLGMRFANVSPEAIFRQIEFCLQNPEELKRASVCGMEKVARYRWKPTAERIVEIACEMVDAD